MASITRENINTLHDKISVVVEKNDYQQSFDKALKEYSKKANIPGFRKGMVPSGLIKKMYGKSLFADEVLKAADKGIVDYVQAEKLDVFGQPIPIDTELPDFDPNNPADYTFQFEIGLKPAIELPQLSTLAITKYVVPVTDTMKQEEISNLQKRYGSLKDAETAVDENYIVDVQFTQIDTEGNEKEGGINKNISVVIKYFKESFRANFIGKKAGDSFTTTLNEAFEGHEKGHIIKDLGIDETDIDSIDAPYKVTINKTSINEISELNEELFNKVYPGAEIKTVEDFETRISDEISNYWNQQSRNQIHDQLFHSLGDNTTVDLPQEFLKKWVKIQNADKDKKSKTDEEIENEFPAFLKQIKWNLITDKIAKEQNIEVGADELRNFARQQLFSYMGNMGMNAPQEEQPWMASYIEKMMQDQRYLEDTYNRIQLQKIFDWGETQVNPTEQEMTAEDFSKMVEAHQHEHHH